jgi:hypothetical protein
MFVDVILLLLPLCAAEQTILAQLKESPFDTKFSDLVKETLDLWHVPGVAIGVVDDDSVWNEVSLVHSSPKMLRLSTHFGKF